MSRRAKGDGSVLQRKDGRWEAAYVDPRDGRRHRAYARTKTEAQQKLRDMQVRAAKGVVALDSGARLDDYLEAWLADGVHRRRRESTVREYAWRLRKYVIPALGKIRLRDLRSSDIERMLDGLAAKGLKQATLSAIKKPLSAALQQAVRDRLIAVNPAQAVQLPDAARSAPVKPVDVEAAARLIVAAEGTSLYDLVLFIAISGCRIGEALALRWSQVDLDKGFAEIDQTMTKNRDGRYVIGEETKTGQVRTVALPASLIEVLRTRRTEVIAQRLKAGPLWQDHDLVFPSAIGTAQDPHNVRRRLKLIAKKVGFEGSFQALRHFMVSVAISSGEPLAVIQKVVGHRKLATTTDIYGHLVPQDAVRITSAVSSAVNDAMRRVADTQNPRSE